MRKLSGILLILLGVFLFALPKLEVWYYQRQEQQILDAWLASMASLEAVAQPDPWDDLPAYDAAGANQDLKNRDQRMRREAEERERFIKENTEGILQIPKIDLYMPVLRGTTEQNLKISLGSIAETGKPGAVGNYCVAGHRSRTYGRQFNRLDELEAGDTITMITGEQEYQYVVEEKLLVKPDETWVLLGNDSDRQITLVTCDYSEKPSLRLVVKGKMKG